MIDLCHLPADELVRLMSAGRCRAARWHPPTLNIVRQRPTKRTAASRGMTRLMGAQTAGGHQGHEGGRAGLFRWYSGVAVESLKPTHGRIPETGGAGGDAPGVFGPSNWSGPLARTVEDLYFGCRS